MEASLKITNKKSRSSKGFLSSISLPRLWMSLVTFTVDLFAWLITLFILISLDNLDLNITFTPRASFLLGFFYYFLLASSRGLYQLVGLSPVYEIKKVAQTLSASVILMVLTYFFLLSNHDPAHLTIFLLAWILLFGGILLLRWSARILLVRLGYWGETAVIIAENNQRGEELLRYFLQHQRLGLRPKLVVFQHNRDGQKSSDGIPTVGLDKFLSDGFQSGIGGTLLLEMNASHFLSDPVYRKKIFNAFEQVLFLANFDWLNGTSLAVRDFEGMIGLEAVSNNLSPTQSILKRLIDIVGALSLLLLSLPLWLWTMIAIKRDSPGPVFYIQKRIGKNGKPFGVLKFRTMMMGADAFLKEYLAKNPAAQAEWGATQKLVADPRITKPGKWIRKFSIDELPQLLNILKGEMSLVGPRPMMTNQVDAYGENFSAYCSISPGLTGMWQVSGRNNLSFEDRARFDLYYLRNWSLWLDFYILLRTVWVVVVTQDGAN